MQPVAIHLRQLEERVRILEAENRALRAKLDAVSRSSVSLPDGASATEVAVVERLPGRIAESVATQEGTGESISVPLDPEDKIRLFQSRFTGRTDIYARRWENHDGTKKGYAPVCANEWRKGICKKPVVSCHECTHRDFEPITDAVIRDHLRGKQIVGLYSLDTASRCGGEDVATGA